MKRFFPAAFLLPVFFTSCWISPGVSDYEKIDDTYYFYDFDTMAHVIVPEINSAFSDWHYNKKKLQEKYDYYLNNIDKNQENYEYLQSSDYSYAVKNNTSGSTVFLKDGKTFKNKYFWFTEKDGDSVILFMN